MTTVISRTKKTTETQPGPVSPLVHTASSRERSSASCSPVVEFLIREKKILMKVQDLVLRAHLFLRGKTRLTFIAPVSTISSEINEAVGSFTAAMIVAWTFLNVESGMDL